MNAQSGIRIRGRIEYVLRGSNGRVKAHGVTHNLVTSVGDNYFAAKAYSSPTAAAGMKLGTTDTAATKSGAGSFITTGDYITGSNKAWDSTWPKAGASANIVQYKRTYAAGEATNSTINRVSFGDNITDAGETDASHTYAVALLDPRPVNKGANDTLTITWDVTFLGA